MATIKIEKIIYFSTDVTNDNREMDFNANVLYYHGKKLKIARLDLCYVSKTATLSKDQHTHKPFEHKNRLLATIEIYKNWR